jgi:hypothetical protein
MVESQSARTAARVLATDLTEEAIADAPYNAESLDVTYIVGAHQGDGQIYSTVDLWTLFLECGQ